MATEARMARAGAGVQAVHGVEFLGVKKGILIKAPGVGLTPFTALLHDSQPSIKLTLYIRLTPENQSGCM